jgi:hypothetical protein
MTIMILRVVVQIHVNCGRNEDVKENRNEN